MFAGKWHVVFRVNTILFVRSCGCGEALRNVLDWRRSRHWRKKTLELQEVVRERRLQTKSLFSKASKADLGTKVAPGTRSDALGEACGFVIPDGTWNKSVEDVNDDR